MDCSRPQTPSYSISLKDSVWNHSGKKNTGNGISSNPLREYLGEVQFYQNCFIPREKGAFIHDINAKIRGSAVLRRWRCVWERVDRGRGCLGGLRFWLQLPRKLNKYFAVTVGPVLASTDPTLQITREDKKDMSITEAGYTKEWHAWVLHVIEAPVTQQWSEMYMPFLPGMR